MKQVLSEALGIALLEAMGCPTEMCSRVSLTFELGELAGVQVNYHLDPAWLEAAGKKLKETLP